MTRPAGWSLIAAGGLLQLGCGGPDASALSAPPSVTAPAAASGAPAGAGPRDQELLEASAGPPFTLALEAPQRVVVDIKH